MLNKPTQPILQAQETNMKPGRIAIYIIIFYLMDIFYEATYRPFPRIHREWFDVFNKVEYYLAHYGILFAVSLYALLVTKRMLDRKFDRLALFTLSIYTAGKFIFYLLIINRDMPTYIDWCNSKPVALSTSILLWGFSCLIWYKTFRIKRLLYDRRY
jgi:hypothetical protein